VRVITRAAARDDILRQYRYDLVELDRSDLAERREP